MSGFNFRGAAAGIASTTNSTAAAVAAADRATTSSASSSHFTPQRFSRGGARGAGRAGGGGGGPRHPDRRPRDTANYADLLLEQLLAAHANSPTTDSDTSPPSAEDPSAASRAVSHSQPGGDGGGDPENNNNVSKDQKCAMAPVQLQFPSPCPSSPRTHSDTPAALSGTMSDHRLSPAPSLVCQQEPQPDSANASRLVNTTSGSTPELPTSESSDSLDIPFASMFDKMDGRDPSSGELVLNISEFNLSQNPVSPDRPQAPFPTRYSHSYARELQKIELAPQQNAQVPESNTHHLSPSKPTIPEPTLPESNSIAETAVSKGCFQFGFTEPLVVSLPPLSHDRKFDKSDHNINRNYKPHLGNKTAHFELEDLSTSPTRPPIPPRRPMTDSKLGKFLVRSSNAEVGSLWLPSDNAPQEPKSASNNVTQCFYQSQQASRETEASPTSESNTSWSFHDITGFNSVPQDPSLIMSTGRAYWSEKQSFHKDCFVTIRPQQATKKNTSFDGMGLASDSASKRRKVNDKTARPISESTNSAEDTAPSKSARQRLFMSPTPSPAQPCSSPGSPTSRVRRKKRQSPAMRRLSQQKENNALSPAQETKSPRKPLTDLYNIQLNDSELLTTSSNSLTQSSEAYVKSSETSPDIPLISREEDLLDRDAYYCDFTVDRQTKIDALSAKKLNPFRPAPSTEEKRYILRDPSTKEILVRSVEGAESSPTSFAFPVPLSTIRAPKQQNQAASASASRHSASQDADSHISTPRGRAASSRWAFARSSNTSNTRCQSSPRSSHRSPSVSSTSSRGSSRHVSPTPRTRSSSSRSSRSSARKTTSHPIASSTFIMESGPTSPEAESESVYTWSIDEDASSCNLEKSYIRSTGSKKKNKFKSNQNTPRPPTSVGRDSPKNGFDITSMVHRFDQTINNPEGPLRQAEGCHSDLTMDASQGRQTFSREISGKRILAAAPSIIRRMDASKMTNSQDSEVFSVQSSNVSSCQATTSSMFFNRAKASIQCSSTEASQVSNLRHLSPESAGHFRLMSSSEPNLRLRRRHNNNNNAEAKEEEEASHSLVPTDTDTTPETSELEERLVIPGKSSSSGSSTCTAARCRPREWRRSPAKALAETPVDVEVTTSPAMASEGAVSGSPEHIPEGETSHASPHPNQDLLDSILTDSPKSVDSSGIFAPYNSYNSPVESVGSHNGYSSTVSSSLTSSDTNYNYSVRSRSRAPGCTAPPPTPPHTRTDQRVDEAETTATVVETAGNTSTSTFVGKAQPAATRPADDVAFKRPFAPAPHMIHTLLRPPTRNQGVTAEEASASASSSTGATPRRPMSVRSDPLANQSVFAVAPGVVTGPPKIKDKKSLVRKFKKFSSHFYKKEKIQTLANL